MLVYQALDEENCPVGKLLDVIIATQPLQRKLLRCDEHLYEVEGGESEQEPEMLGV